MLSDPLFLATALLAVLLVGLGKGGFSGIGMVAAPLLALTIPPLQALAILLPILLVQDLLALWWYGRVYDKWNLKVMLPGAFVGAGAAWAVGSVVSDDVVRLLIGVIGVGFVLNVWFGKVPPTGRPSALRGVICGAGSAFTSTIANAGMPPFAIHVFPQRLDKMTLVGTITIFFTVVNWMRTVPYFALGELNLASLKISLVLLPLAIAFNFLGFWLVQRVPTEVFYRIAHMLIFLVSSMVVVQGVVGLLRGSGIFMAMTRDDVLVVSHDRRLNPDHTRGPDGKFLDAEGPAIRSLTLAEVQRYDVGRLKPRSNYATSFPQQKAADGARIPALTEVFDLVKRSGAAHVRFNIETKLTPTSGAETPDPDIFAAALARAIREAGLTTRVTIQSFDWRTLKAMQRIAPDITRVCLTAEALTFDTVKRGEAGPSPWLAGLDIDEFGGSLPRLVQAAGCTVWSPLHRNAKPDDVKTAQALGLKVIPWTVNERADMEKLIALGVDGIITDYPDRLRAVMAEKNMPLPPQVKAQ